MIITYLNKKVFWMLILLIINVIGQITNNYLLKIWVQYNKLREVIFMIIKLYTSSILSYNLTNFHLV